MVYFHFYCTTLHDTPYCMVYTYCGKYSCYCSYLSNYINKLFRCGYRNVKFHIYNMYATLEFRKDIISFSVTQAWHPNLLRF